MTGRLAKPSSSVRMPKSFMSISTVQSWGKIKQPHVAIQADVDELLAQLIPLVEAQPRAEWHSW